MKTCFPKIAGATDMLLHPEQVLRSLIVSGYEKNLQLLIAAHRIDFAGCGERTQHSKTCASADVLNTGAQRLLNTSL